MINGFGKLQNETDIEGCDYKVKLPSSTFLY